MREIPTFIEGYQKVVEVYGYWPSFHDANVRVTLDPGVKFYDQTSRIGLQMHAFETTSEVINGYFVLTNHRQIQMEFDGVYQATDASLLEKEIILSLNLGRDAAPKSDVQINILFCCGTGRVEFTAKSGRVLAVETCDEKGTVKKTS